MHLVPQRLDPSAVSEATYDIPDFTRGGWRTAKPLGILDVDLNRYGAIRRT